ncbi:MAG: 50S ribosomal protein L13 [Candidatus Peregrinibacteria bacterium]
MKTTHVKPQAPHWILIDADGKVLGRIATKIVMILRGKNRADWSPHMISGDHVVIINAAKLKMTEAKYWRKTYFKHSGYLGHMKATPLKQMMERRPVEVIEKAIYGMLPDNRLRAQALKRLHVFAGTEHDHTAQKPVPLSLS